MCVGVIGGTLTWLCVVCCVLPFSSTWTWSRAVCLVILTVMFTLKVSPPWVGVAFPQTAQVRGWPDGHTLQHSVSTPQ